MTKYKEAAITQIKTARGQIDGILKMIDEERYCIDICVQLQSAMAILKKAELLILEGHIKGCVRAALKQGDAEEKVEEIVKLLGKAI